MLSEIRSSICRSDGIPYRYPTSRYFTSTTGSMGGRPYRRQYICAVSSYTNDRSSADASLRRKWSAGTRSSMVTMCSLSCMSFAPCGFSLFYHIRAPDGRFVNRPNLARSSGKHDDGYNFAPSWRKVSRSIKRVHCGKMWIFRLWGTAYSYTATHYCLIP